MINRCINVGIYLKNNLVYNMLQIKVHHTGAFSSILRPLGQRRKSDLLRTGIATVSCIIDLVTRIQAYSLLIDLYTREHCSCRTRCIRHLFVHRIRLKHKMRNRANMLSGKI